LRLEAILQAQDGRADAALDAGRGILNVGRSIGDEPCTISQLVRFACAAIAIQSLERTLAQGQPTEEALQAAQKLLEEEAAEPSLLIAARGERAGQHRLAEALARGEAKFSTVAGSKESMADVLGRILTRRYHPSLLRLLNEFVEIAKLPVEQQAERLKQLDQAVRQARAEGDLLVGLLMPAVVKIAEAFRRTQAQLRCAAVALAAERYRLAHGHWPETPDALLAGKYLQKLPADPFDGKPLRFRARDDGLIIYSVGPDEQDNGGRLDRQKPLAPGTDLGFRLWNVDRRRQPSAELVPPPAEEIQPPPGADK
jgi:hypothetical protein